MDSILKETDEQLFEEYKMYDAIQYLDNTQKNLATADYCYYFIGKILAHFEEVQKNYHEVKQATLNRGEIFFAGENNAIDISIEIMGEPINGHFLLDKYLKDFIQYSRNAFDSISQFINKTVLYSNPLDIEKVDFIKVYLMLKSNHAHLEIFEIVEKIKTSEEFQYISEFNNKTKHISDTNTNLSFDLLGIGVESKITAFKKRNQTFGEKNLEELIRSLSDFLKKEFSILVDHIIMEIPKSKLNEKRFHKVDFIAKLTKGEPQNSYVDVFIIKDDIDMLPEEIEFLFVKKHILKFEGKFQSRNFPYNEIFVKNSDGFYIGKFSSLTPYESNKELNYRKFRKQRFKNPKLNIRDEKGSKSHLNYYSGYMSGEIYP